MSLESGIGMGGSLSRHEELVAVELVKQMCGGSRSLLLLDQYAEPWVVKFCENPQHQNVVVNEYLGTRLAKEVGLTVSINEQIWVGQRLTDLINKSLPGFGHISAGLHFASRYAGGLMPGFVVDRLPAKNMGLTNGHEVAGVSIFDLWVRNRDERQAVHIRQPRSKRYTTYWIDFGNCFGGPSWHLDISEPTSFGSEELRRRPCADDYEPWIERIEQLPTNLFTDLFETIPFTWRSGREQELSALKRKLLSRRERLRPLLSYYLTDHRSEVFIRQ